MAGKLEYAVVGMHELSAAEQQEVAAWVADYLAEVGHEQYQMMRQSEEQILGKLGMVAFALDSDGSYGEKAGYMGATPPSEGMAEVGSLFVVDKYQRAGIAMSLMKATVSHLLAEQMTPYIFCNDNSLPIAEKCGFKLATNQDVPACAIAACGECSLMQKGLVAPGQCCDTIMVYEGAEQYV